MCRDELIASLDGNWIIPIDDTVQQAQPNGSNLEIVDSAVHGATETFDIAAGSLRRIVLGAPNSSRFLGKLSERTLVQTAVELKKKYTSDTGTSGNPQTSERKIRRDEFWKAKPVR